MSVSNHSVAEMILGRSYHALVGSRLAVSFSRMRVSELRANESTGCRRPLKTTGRRPNAPKAYSGSRRGIRAPRIQSAKSAVMIKGRRCFMV